MKFLTHDGLLYFWEKVKSYVDTGLKEKANSSHTHVKSQITDFPTSLPASGGNADTLGGKSDKDFANATHTHDDRYYTESEIDTKLDTKANASHTHVKSQITDFPTSLPASGGNADTLSGVDINGFCKVGSKTLDNIDLNSRDIELNTWFGLSSSTKNAPCQYGIFIRTKLNNKYSNWLYDTAWSTNGLRFARESINGAPWTKWRDMSKAVGGNATTLGGKYAKDFANAVHKHSKADITDFPTSLPANGGNADMLGGLSSSDYMKTTYKTLYNGASLFSYVLNDMKDSTSEVVRIYDGTDVPIEYGYVPKANDFIFHINKIDHGYSIIRAHDNRSNREFMIRSGSNIWSKWKEVGYGGMTYLRATNVDLFAYIDGLTDEDFPPNSTITIRAFNCKNSPLDGFPVKVDYSLSNGGDFIIEASRLEGKEWCVLTAREIHTNFIFTCGKRGGIWKTWNKVGDITILPDRTDIEKDFLNNQPNDYHWSVRTFRIGNSESAPTNLGYDPNNNDFYYTVYKMGHDWIKIIARDVRSNRQFINSKLGGSWTGWSNIADGGNAERINGVKITVSGSAPVSPSKGDLWIY